MPGVLPCGRPANAPAAVRHHPPPRAGGLNCHPAAPAARPAPARDRRRKPPRRARPPAALRVARHAAARGQRAGNTTPDHPLRMRPGRRRARGPQTGSQLTGTAR
ncbi:hypothetical protein ADN00_13990 [Ornatilinea apprima]|uniref:Uncharacterized protein n=1 Tax=Ornatilinea apprima TaxID=1134406 RepID=A0A0P6XGU9_9CHLR|nr:hypothetical protein ADN00_13990 [Ornatilinea apprima]